MTAAEPLPELAVRRFTAEDQARFAQASGDRNPIHRDPRAARRTVAGEVVVHGVHGALWALEVLAARLPALPTTVRAQFHRFIPLDRDVRLRATSLDDGGLRAELVLDGLVATTLVLAPAMGAPGGGDWDSLPAKPLGATPLTPVEFDGLQGWSPPPDGAAQARDLFPLLCDWAGAERVAAVAQLSAIVGMVCPGLHSIFSELSIRLIDTPPRRPGVGYRARLPDPRFGRVHLAIAGAGLEGEIRAMIRPAPIAPPSMSDLAPRVSPGEFADRRALIIGGSRGLGAVTAKLLAAGGAEVVLTYATGIAEASEVVADIGSRAGAGAARGRGCDMREPFDAGFAAELAACTHLYYFATPHITRQATTLFSPATFAEFSRIYIERFYDLCRLALDARSDLPLSVFYPSTVAIDDRPKGMAEYAMSKAAGEQLCQELARATPSLSITAPRLPRTLTDQTASPLPVRAQDPVDVMLPLLRAERPAIR